MCKSLRFIGLVLLLFVIVPLVSQSATIEVMNIDDSGPGSLRQAIADADPAGGDDIVFNPSLDGELFLVNSPLAIDKSLTITGLGKDNMALENNNAVEDPFVIIENEGEDLTVIIQELEIRNSFNNITVLNNENLTINDSRIRGGAICIRNLPASELFINDSIIEFCSQTGVSNQPGTSELSQGIATISRTDINGNYNGIGNSGGFFLQDTGGMMTIYDTTIRNSASFGIVNNGGIFGAAKGATLNMFRTSVINNRFGISNGQGSFDTTEGAVLNAQNSTIAGNREFGIVNRGGERDSTTGAQFTCNFCTIANNLGNGVNNEASTNGNPGEVELFNIIIANNGDGSTTFNCVANANFLISDDSKVTDDTCFLTPVTLPSLELGPLQNNGGFAPTIAIGATSSARDVVLPADCEDLDMNPLTSDQRLFPRPFGPNCDVGAFEFQPTGTLTIEKIMLPPGGTGFEFFGTNFPLGCGLMDSFFLDDQETISCVLLPDTYTVEEVNVPPDTIFDITCNQSATIVNNELMISIGEGDDALCTFTTTEEFTLNLTIDGNGTGTVDISPPDETCEPDCSQTYPFNEAITLTPNAGPTSQFVGFAGDAGCGADITMTEDLNCTATFDLLPLILNPIFPGVASNPNSITVEQASPNGNVAFIWGFMAGSTIIGGPTCNGIEIGMNDPRLLGIIQAGANQIANFVVYIPLNPAFQNPVLVQAVDIPTCRTSDVVTNIILSE